MSPRNDLQSVLADPQWLPSHWDRPGAALQFAWLPRDRQRELTFLADEYLREIDPPLAIFPISQFDLAQPSTSPVHYIVHAAFCCSTLLTRALDIPGASMGLKEPQILNDLAGGLRTRALPPELLELVVRLLARPFSAGEAVVVKPSNVANLLAPALLDTDERSHALFLHAPLPRFLRSVADKGLWGRRWARRVYPLVRGDTGLDLGLSLDEQFELTDLQVSALAWLMQQTQGAALLARFPDRVRWLDSEHFLRERAATIAALGAHFGLSIDERKSRDIAQGPAFSTHSKELGRGFDPDEPLRPRLSVAIIDEEVAMVVKWTQTVAAHAGISMDLPPEAALLST